MIFRHRRRLAVAAALVAMPLSSASASVGMTGSSHHAAQGNVATAAATRAGSTADMAYDSGTALQGSDVLRDYRDGEVHTIAPAMLQLLWVLRAQLGTAAPLDIISGFRTPQTNAKLHA